MRKNCKKLVVLILVMAMALCVSSCGIGFDNGGVSPDAPSVITTDGKADIDNCHIEITDCKAQISAFSQFIAVVSMDFYNGSDAATSLFFTASIKAYQNGMELSLAAWSPADHGIAHDYTTSIQPGYTLSTGCAFVIADTSAPITIQICDGTTVVSEKTFTL